MIWQWPLRSPARLAVVGGAVALVVVGTSLAGNALGGGSSGTEPAGSTSGTGTAFPTPSGAAVTLPPATVPAPTALPPVAELAPTTLPLAQAPAAALDVAARWSGAWVRPPAGTTNQQWLDGLRATTTDEYLGVLSGVDPANIPATRLVGEPRAVQVAARSVQVEVPTDALELLVLVVDTESGWRVAGYDRV